VTNACPRVVLRLTTFLFLVAASASADADEPAPAPPPPASDVERRLAESERAIIELRAALAEAERRRALDEERRQNELRALRIDDELRHKYELSVRSRNAGIRLSGFVHMDTVAYNHASKDEVDVNGDPQNETRFLLRRSRIRVDADYKWLFGAFEIDANTNRGSRSGRRASRSVSAIEIRNPIYRISRSTSAWCARRSASRSSRATKSVSSLSARRWPGPSSPASTTSASAPTAAGASSATPSLG